MDTCHMTTCHPATYHHPVTCPNPVTCPHPVTCHHPATCHPAACPHPATCRPNTCHAVTWQASKHDEALADAKQAIKLDPAWPKGYLRAGRSLMSMERHAEAEALLRQGRELVIA
eukprot:5083419-Prymnesium_polylepis.1